MALLHIEGFEQYDTPAQVNLSKRWTVTTSLSSIVTGRAGGSSNAFRTSIVNTFLQISGGIATDFLVCGFAIQWQSSLSNLDLMHFRDGGLEQIVLSKTSGGDLRIARGATELEITSGLGLTSGIWYYIEMKILVHPSAGTYEVRVDGVAVLGPATSQNTRSTANNNIDQVRFVSSNEDEDFDDIYILDDAGSDNVDFLGDCTVETLLPDADGATNDFTPVGSGSTNADRVDDGENPDDDTTYVHSSTVTDKDLYGFAALQSGIDTIFGVSVGMYVRKEDAGHREIRALARSGTAEVEGPSRQLSVDYNYVEGIYENDPDGGGDWDEAAVNAAQFGITIQT